jgi:hypothetical protein
VLAKKVNSGRKRKNTKKVNWIQFPWKGDELTKKQNIQIIKTIAQEDDVHR